MGNLFSFIVVGDKIDGLFFEIFEQCMGDLGHTDFGVTHGGSGITIHRPKVTLAVDQHIAQRERLGHTYDGFINGRVTVRVILTDYVADHTG